jgi:hypothetical protein
VATISSVCPRSNVLGPIEASGQAPSVTVGSCLLGGVPGAKTGAPSLGEVPGAIARVSSSSWMEGLKRSCTKTPCGATPDSIQARPEHRQPHYLTEGCGGAQNHRISLLIFLPPAGKPPCRSHNNLTLPSPS